MVFILLLIVIVAITALSAYSLINRWADMVAQSKRKKLAIISAACLVLAMAGNLLTPRFFTNQWVVGAAGDVVSALLVIWIVIVVTALASLLPSRKWAKYVGGALSLLIVGAYLYGHYYERRTITVNRYEVHNEKLSPIFENRMITFISDLHLASMVGAEEYMENLVERINESKPDIVIFGGDAVTYTSAEFGGFVDILSKINAKMGKYAVIGNHDYGDYHSFTDKEKAENRDAICDSLRYAGFTVLRNEHDIISIGEHKLAIIGIENWGRKPFPTTGDIRKATDGLPQGIECILISHDPDFWSDRLETEDHCFLTLSGHTHDIQFGLAKKGNYYSLKSRNTRARYGMYQLEDKSCLIVSRGVGCTGVMARVGAAPEIVEIILRR